jgi:AcrR family transcriptional regulator
MRQIVRDCIGSFFDRTESVGMRAHERKDALDAGIFPARRDVDQNQRAERRARRLRDEAEQAAHRRADKDRRGHRGLRGMLRQQDQVIDELREIVRAIGVPAAVAVTAAVGGQAAPAFVGQRSGGAGPGMPGLAEAMCKYQAGCGGVAEVFDGEVHAATRAQPEHGAGGAFRDRLGCDSGFHTGEYVWGFSSCQYGSEWSRSLSLRNFAATQRRQGFTFGVRSRYHAGMLQAAVDNKFERTRLSAADWEQAALDVIAEQGVAAVTVESLARQLGVTKGSFYWHFPTREALLKAALERWESQDVDNVFAQVEPIADPRARLCELFRRTGREAKSHVIYSALLRALDHPLVHPVMERVSRRRMDFLTLAYRQVGMNRAQAGHRARLAYAAYVGFLQLALQLGVPRLDHAEFENYVQHVIDTLIPQ